MGIGLRHLGQTDSTGCPSRGVHATCLVTLTGNQSSGPFSKPPYARHMRQQQVIKLGCTLIPACTPLCIIRQPKHVENGVVSNSLKQAGNASLESEGASTTRKDPLIQVVQELACMSLTRNLGFSGNSTKSRDCDLSEKSSPSSNSKPFTRAPCGAALPTLKLPPVSKQFNIC